MTMVEELEERWEFACDRIKGIIGSKWIENETDYERLFNDLLRNCRSCSSVMIGICGPGASGKSTFLNTLCEKYGFRHLVNATTRKPRINEVNGKDYYFLSQTEYLNSKNNGEFAVWVEKSGRGFYGIYKKDMLELLNNNCNILVIESPLVLHQLFKEAETACFNSIKLYIFYFIPEFPIVNNLVGFLNERQETISLDNIMVEHGWRQIEEFSSLISVYGGIANVYVIQGCKPIEIAEKIGNILF